MKVSKKILTTMAVAGATIGLGAATANADTVTVQTGDTVSGLAQKYHTTIDEIQKENKLANVNLIYAGQQLQIDSANQSSVTVQNPKVVASSTNTTTTSQNVISDQKTSVQNTQATQQNNVVANTNYSSNVNGNDAAAKAWIAQHESSNNYNARNGQYIGKYQLSASYLHGDYSPANQERCADQYVAQRYGSWSNAKQHWLANGWY